jgi:predicted MFS family arabinose efflux permease
VIVPYVPTLNLDPKKERVLLALLAAVQFTTVLDFLIVLPLGPQYMQVMHIGPSQFGLIVSSYAISAGLSGIAAGFFLDYFDRKRALLFLFGGFMIGTLFCALAPTYPLLVLARAVAGAFGGITGALILAIVGDAIPEQRRGAAMGLVMSAFSMAMIGGVPCGLYLACTNWHVPFFALAGLSAVILVIGAWVLPTMRDHLAHVKESHPVARFWSVLIERDHQMALIFMGVLTFAGAMIFPYIATYMVTNTGMTQKQLPFIYLVGGACTLFSMNLIGRWSDRIGKPRAFSIMSASATIPILLLTNLHHVAFLTGIAVTTIFMICMSGRSVPAMAMITSTVKARYRGGFMSANSSVQQFATGLATYASGQIMGQTAQGELTHFPVIGLLSVAGAWTCIALARYLKSAVEDPSVPAPSTPVWAE